MYLNSRQGCNVNIYFESQSEVTIDSSYNYQIKKLTVIMAKTQIYANYNMYNLI